MIDKKHLKSKNEEIFYIELLREGNVRKLFSKESNIIENLFE